jgi:hypothetical protein
VHPAAPAPVAAAVAVENLVYEASGLNIVVAAVILGIGELWIPESVSTRPGMLDAGFIAPHQCQRSIRKMTAYHT